jgi:DNA-binding NarL/FixJ family response regulator
LIALDLQQRWRGNAMNALLMDDHAVARTGPKHLPGELRNFSTHNAANNHQGTETRKRDLPEFIILDLELSAMGGAPCSDTLSEQIK